MRWLTQNALRLIGPEGNQSDELNDLAGRDQLEILSKLLEAVINSNSEPAKQSVENKQNAAPKQKASAAQVKESGSGKRASKAEEIFDEPDAEAVKKETKSPKRGSRPETKPSAETRKPKKAPVESVDDFEEEYDPIAFWENFPDDEDEPSDADRDGRKEPADKETKVADDSKESMDSGMTATSTDAEEGITEDSNTEESDPFIESEKSDTSTETDIQIDEETYPAFNPEPVIIDGVRISVSAAEGVFPEGASLSVAKVSNAELGAVEEALDVERDETEKVAISYTYDIKVFDKDGNE
ncbi:MAG: hypothetical protein IIU43_08645, partial [Thermoguttaceae bacterium]|nr:hypothetical protein [Thermoguttaceae bacterium]